jgi:hypothetical protein
MLEYPTEGGALLQVDSSGWPEAAAKKIKVVRYITQMSLFRNAHWRKKKNTLTDRFFTGTMLDNHTNLKSTTKPYDSTIMPRTGHPMRTRKKPNAKDIEPCTIDNEVHLLETGNG